MDIEKSIYMRDFTTSRMSFGSITYEPVYSPLSQNIYGDLKPKKIVKQVEDVIDEIEEKTILILKNSDPLKQEEEPKPKKKKEQKPKKEKEVQEEEKEEKKEEKKKDKEEKEEKKEEKKKDKEEDKEEEKEVVLFEDAAETEDDKEGKGAKDGKEGNGAKDGKEGKGAKDGKEGKDTLEDDPIMEGGSMVKTITFNPNYVVGE